MNEKGEMVVADEKLSKEKRYFCPECRNLVHLKIGAVMRPHFAHYQNESCDVFSEGETAEHLQGKLQLADVLERLPTIPIKVELEAYLPELKQRPDLLVEFSRSEIAVEFQCSPISIEKIAERTAGYLSAGYQVCWVLGEKFKYGRKLTSLQKACLAGDLTLLHYEVEQNRLIMRRDFNLDQNERMSCLREVVDAASLQKSKDRVVRQNTSQFDIQKRHKKLIRDSRNSKDKTREFFHRLYQNGENIVTMPSELYWVAPSEWMLQTYSYHWKYLFLLWLEQFPKHKVLTENNLRRWIQEQEVNGALKFYTMPQLTTEMKSQPFLEYIEALDQMNVLKEISHQKWVIAKEFKRYKMLEEKFEEDF